MESPSSASLPPHPGSRGAERRRLTVLFCDLFGSADFAQRLDPEDLGGLIGAFQGVCRSAIHRYDGFVARYVGEEVLAYFGYPRAYEENAERAIRAALRIVEGVKALNESGAAREAERVSVRIGIASGPVVVGDVIGEGAAQQSTVIGEAANLAARLRELAGRDSIVIANETRLLAQDYFSYRDLGEQPLKGMTTSARAWQVTGERSTEARFDARQRSGITPYVGRVEELALILRRWEQAKDGEGQVLLLCGEPGIGKSRLAQVLRDTVAPEPHALFRYQCSPYHADSTLYPIVEQIRRAAGFDETDDARSRADKMEATLGQVFDDVPAVAPLFAALLSIDAPERYPVLHLRPGALKDATLKALAGSLFAFAARQPVLLVVEDAHWIDPSTQELLDLLVAGIAHQRVLAVITYRPEYHPSWSSLPHVMTLPLTRLPRRDAALLAENVAGGRALPAEVADQIVARTDGVPLFIEELTKTLIETGVLVEAGGGYRVARALPEADIPATLHDSLMARLDRAGRARDVAQVGACIGRQFSRHLLATVLKLDDADLDRALDDLERAGLLRRAEGGGHYAFKHALIQDAACGTLLKGARRQIHACIAEALAASGDVVLSAPEVLARHYMEAGSFEQAASCWCRAAERAGARYANAEVIAHCRNGLQALAGVPRGSARTDVELKLRIGLAAGLRITDSYGEALAELGTAEALAAEHDHLRELSRIRHLRGNIYYPLGKVEHCFAEHEAAWRFAREAGSTEDEARALGGLGDAHFLAGRIRQSHQCFEECVALSRTHALTLTEIAYLPMRGVTHMYCLRFREALADCRSVFDLVARVGQARGELISRSTSAWIYLDESEPEPAEEHARKGLEAIERIGARRFIPLFNDVIARLRLNAGDRAGALELLDESWSVARATGIAFAGPVVLGAVALAADDAGRRVEALRQGEAILGEGSPSHNHFRFYRDAMEVALRERRWDATETYAAALERQFGTDACPASSFFVARGRALAAAGDGGREGRSLAQLRRLRDYAADLGIRTALPGLDEALAGA